MRIASVGACTAVGLNAVSSAAAVRAGVSAFGAHPYVVDAAGDRVIVAQVPEIDVGLPVSQRMAFMASAAMHEAIEWNSAQRAHGIVPVYLTLPNPRPGLDRDAIASVADSVARELVACGVRAEIGLVDGGHAGGLIALKECCSALAQRGGDWGLVGGVDSWLEPETLEWLEADDRLHNAVNPWGLVPGEGAAFYIVCGPSLTTVKGALDVVGFGVAAEAIARRGEEPCLGKGLTAAIQDAIAALPEGQSVDEVFCDYNGEWDRADEYGFALVRTSMRFVDATAARTPADCWGDVGAATGSLLVALAWQAAQRRWLGGRNLLLWSSSDGPHRAAAMVRVV